MFEALQPAMIPAAATAIDKGLSYDEAKCAFQTSLAAEAMRRTDSDYRAAKILKMAPRWFSVVVKRKRWSALQPAMTPAAAAAIDLGLSYQQATAAYEQAVTAEAIRRAGNKQRAAQILRMARTWLSRVSKGNRRGSFNRGGGKKPKRLAAVES
ncbi:MAG: hypothetical protein LAO20_14195 [Acidobacteriia bacterium]|nr:hypothetical protein [Terriglobia bacterium]